MDGPQLLTYVKRRLALEGVSDEQLDDNELYDYIAEGRDEVRRRLAIACPRVLEQTEQLARDVNDSRIYALGSGVADPLRWRIIREAGTGKRELVESENTVRSGDFEWNGLRAIRLARELKPQGGVEAKVVLAVASSIGAPTIEEQIGLPLLCHRAIGKYAAYLALTANEESDARNAFSQYEAEVDKLETLYGMHYESGAQALRDATLANYSEWSGEIY